MHVGIGRRTRKAGCAMTVLCSEILFAGWPCNAETHCGIDVGNPAHVAMWQLQPPENRKTTRELVVSFKYAHQKFRACKESGLTVVLKLSPGGNTVFSIKD